MPNTPMAIGKGMVGLAPLPALEKGGHCPRPGNFSVSAKVLVVEEGAMDALTAVSGSGPAYVFRFAEAMFEGAKDLGFYPLEAKTLVSTTLQGSVDYLLSQAEAQSSCRK